MAQPIWTAQHAASLKALRTAAGLEVTVLAKRHNLSVNQVRQLEDGGDSAFYTAQIKLAVGRKLTLALGGEFIEHVPDIETAPIAAPVPATDPPAPGPASPDLKARRVAGPPVAMAHGADGTPPDPGAPEGRKAGTGGRSGTGLWVMSLGAGVVLALGLVWVTQEQESPPAPTAAQEAPASVPPAPDTPTTAADASAPGNASDAKPPASAPAVTPLTPLAPATVVATPAVVAPVAVTAAADAPAATDECRWSRRATDLTPESGNRPDNYVHVVAQETTTVCWRDADKKTRKQTLQAEEKVSFWGTPPFQVYAPNPATLKVYFKGQMVRWSESPDTQHIVLGTRPASAD